MVQIGTGSQGELVQDWQQTTTLKLGLIMGKTNFMTIVERVARDTLLGTIRKNWEKRNHAQKKIGRAMYASTGTLSVSGAHA